MKTFWVTVALMALSALCIIAIWRFFVFLSDSYPSVFAGVCFFLIVVGFINLFGKILGR